MNSRKVNFPNSGCGACKVSRSNSLRELLGLAFDGNYEALSHKLAFDKDLNRTICVDVRYMLWCIEKLGGAKHIIDELKLAK
ncbi:MAG: S46 family peptidase [Haliscomenobacter sp.]|nr:S46 family peptidase [Haliscomenobacter sp.]MDX2068763.1 S46 family peptidase [Haliscomenobacter sp.]